MLKVAMLGGGGHSRTYHLPALRHFVETHPGLIDLAAFCDIDAATADRLTREYGFARAFTDLDAMLAAGPIDACIAITPVHVTARVAMTILTAGIPLLMEKPPGATPEETRQICELSAHPDARVMVSVNRRFDPALAAARRWFGERPIRHVRAAMYRHARIEPAFMTDTAIHCIDAARGMAGEISDYSVRSRVVDAVRWYFIDLEFESGATGVVEIMPTCGCQAEWYELFGTDCRSLARVAEFDLGTWTAWQDGQMVHDEDPTAGKPAFIRNGTYGETEAFFSAIAAGRPLSPTPADVGRSAVICQDIRRRVEAGPV